MKLSTQHAARNTQHGFTLIELLVVIAILSLLTGLLVSIVYQFLTIPRWGNNQLAVDHDLRNAGLWLMRDGNESTIFAPGGTCGVFQTGHGANYTYALSGTELQRSSGGQTLVVAHYVSALACSTAGSQAVVQLDVTKGDVSASQTFSVTMRVD